MQITGAKSFPIAQSPAFPLLGRGDNWFKQGSFFADGGLAALALDFENDRYAVNQNLVLANDFFSFTRSSKMTVFDAQYHPKQIEIDQLGISRNPNTARFGALIEESRTNLIDESIDVTQWNPVGAVVVTDLNSSYGFLNRHSVTSAGATWNRLAADSVALTSGTAYAVTFWIEEGTSGKARLNIRNPGASQDSHISGDFGSFAVSASAAGTITNVSETDTGAFTIVTCTFTPNATANYEFSIGANSTVVGETVIPLAIQVEEGSYPTSLIVTDGSSETRAASNLLIDGTNFSDWYADNAAGTFLVEASQPYDTGQFDRIYEAGDGSNDNRIYINMDGSDADISFKISSGGALEVNRTFDDILGEAHKFAAAFDTDDAAMSFDGQAVVTDGSVTLPSGIDRIGIGRENDAASSYLNGYIYNFAYFDFRVTNSELVRIAT